MLAQIELNPMREQALVRLEQQTGENRADLLLKMFDFYMEHHKLPRSVPAMQPERARLFAQIAGAPEFADEKAVYERYGVKP